MEPGHGLGEPPIAHKFPPESLPVSDLFPYEMRYECFFDQTQITTDQGPYDE